MPNLLVVDDHAVVRSGLKLIIVDFLPHAVVNEAFDGDTAFQLIIKNHYDLIILDVMMPNTDSYSLLTNILKIKPELKVLMFSMNDEEVYARRYLKIGAMGYLKKDEPREEIHNAIKSILNNKRYLSNKLREKIIDELSGNLPNNPFDKLSAREFEVVQHLILGESITAIGRKLNLHSSTIATHKGRIFEKLNCRNLIDLNKLAELYNISQK